MNENLLKMHLNLNNGLVRADKLYLKLNIASTKDFRKEILRLKEEGIIQIYPSHYTKTEILIDEVSLTRLEISKAA